MSVLLTCYKNYFLQIKGKDVAFYFEIIKIYNHSNTNTCSSFPFLILKYVLTGITVQEHILGSTTGIIHRGENWEKCILY